MSKVEDALLTPGMDRGHHRVLTRVPAARGPIYASGMTS